MSVFVMGSVWRFSRSKGGTRLVLLAIADIADDQGVAYPKWDTSIDNIAAKCNVSRRAVQYSIRELESLGELSVQVNNGTSANTFQIHLDRNRPLFDAPPELRHVDEQRQPVDNQPGADPAPVQPVARGGCKKLPKGVQPVAPNPSIRLTHQTPRTAPPPKKTVDKSKLPESAERWIAAGAQPPIIAWAGKHSWVPWLALHFEYFCDYLRANPAYAHEHPDLNACFQNCVRADWGDVRMKAQREARATGGSAAAPGGNQGPLTGKSCRYCPRPATSAVGGIPSCSDPVHSSYAMERRPASNPEGAHA